MIHISDWYPTLLKLVEAKDLEELIKNLDGIDQTSALFEGQTSVIPRREVVNEMGHSGLWGKKRGVLQVSFLKFGIKIIPLNSNAKL